MDPLAIQGAASSGWTRSNQQTPADLQAALQRGRVFAGDVLQTMSGGTVLLGLGPLRVPARAQTQLQPGRRYWFEVISSGSPLELRVADAPDVTTPELLRALRTLLGAEAPLGALLENLARLLGESPAPSPASDAGAANGAPPAEWERALGEHAWRPDEGASELRAKFERSGLTFEGRLAEAALAAAPPAEAQRIGGELLGALVAQAQSVLGDGAQGASLLNRLAQALAQVLGGADHGGAGPASGELDPSRLMQRALAQLAPSEAAALQTALERLDWPRWPTWMRRLLLRTLAPDSAPHSQRSQEFADALQSDLKARLLAAREQLGEGALRNAVDRTLNGIEADQLLNLARAEVDESAQWSVPLHDGERWSTLHLAVVRDGSRGADQSESRARRIALEVEFSRTGAVHVDLLHADQALSARVLAHDPAVVEQLAQRSLELEQLLAAGGAAARVSIARASDERVLHSDAPSRSSYFASRHVMDIEG